jgi:hypothetical protein
MVGDRSADSDGDSDTSHPTSDLPSWYTLTNDRAVVDLPVDTMRPVEAGVLITAMETVPLVTSGLYTLRRNGVCVAVFFWDGVPSDDTLLVPEDNRRQSWQDDSVEEDYVATLRFTVGGEIVATHCVDERDALPITSDIYSVLGFYPALARVL